MTTPQAQLAVQTFKELLAAERRIERLRQTVNIQAAQMPPEDRVWYYRVTTQMAREADDEALAR